MPWQETDVMEQRVRFVVEALNGGLNFSALCRRYGISRRVGYKWVTRYQQAGTLASLADRSRRPRRSPRRTPPAMEARVVAVRRQYGWGGKKLQLLLARTGVQLSAATIDRIIKRHGLIEAPDRPNPAPRRFARAHPNELWQMDFKGEYRLRPRRWCYPLTILDDHSRFAVGLYALAHPQHEPVQARLLDCFERYGVPEELLMDHGAPWWSGTNGFGLTRLSVWLINQGITLRYGAHAHPQTQGKVERFHRSLARALRQRGLPHTVAEFADAFAAYRQEYNEVRPHEALGMAVPASRYHPSRRAYQAVPPEWHYPAGSDVRRLNTQGCLRYHRRCYFVCEALAKEYVACQRFADRLLVTFRHMHIREIDLKTGRTLAIVRPSPRY